METAQDVNFLVKNPLGLLADPANFILPIKDKIYKVNYP